MSGLLDVETLAVLTRQFEPIATAAIPDARSAQPANPEGAAQSGSPNQDGT